MCGIAGFYDTTKRSDRDLLVRITDLLSYRGPDDSGYDVRIMPLGHVGLGHRRLSIIDLSPLGHQPMFFESLSIIFNGEVYNYKEVQQQLEAEGYTFKSTSDSEVILKAFHKWGPQAVERLNGMFAIALFDAGTDELYLIRDRMGVKPLYYFYDGDNIVFGSELKPIMNHPLFGKGEIDSHALNSFIYHGYINAPHSIFKDVFKLEPGHYLKYSKGKIEKKEYWGVLDAFNRRKVNHSMRENEAVDQLDELITNSVRYRMISDVPIGAFLSGGVDSSLVSAIMQKLSRDPINTFTIGFNEADYNEATFAAQVAKHLKTNHREQYLPLQEARSLITKIPLYYDEPFADSSQLPSMLVSQMARKNVTVVLTGDGGDELFCGYSRYSEVMKYKKWQSLSRALSPLRSLPAIERLIGSVSADARKFLYVDSAANIINRSYLFSQFYLDGLVKGHRYKLDNKFFDVINLSPENLQEAYMLQDMTTYLPDDILTKVDRAAMSVGLEGREPLLDYRLLEYSFTIPHELKVKGGELKHLLKQLVYRYVPKEIMDRPKMGFGVPVYEWIHGDMHYLIEKYFSEEFIRQQDQFDFRKMSYLLRMFEENRKSEFFAKMIWHILVFQMWFEKYRSA